MEHLFCWGPLKAPLRLDEFVGAATTVEAACVQGYLQFGASNGFTLYEVEASSLAWACWTQGCASPMGSQPSSQAASGGPHRRDLQAGTLRDCLALGAERLWLRGEAVYRLERIGSATRQRRTRAPYYWLVFGERKATLVIDPRQAVHIRYLDQPDRQRATRAVFA